MGESPQYAYTARQVSPAPDRLKLGPSLAQAFPLSDSGSFADLLLAIDQASERRSVDDERC